MTMSSTVDPAATIPVRAISLSTLHNRTASPADPRLVLTCTPLERVKTHIGTDGDVSKARVLELHENLTRWAGRLQRLGVSVLGASFQAGLDAPAPEGVFLDERDTAALNEALAAPLVSAGTDPAMVSCVLIWRRASGQASLELVGVRTNVGAGSETEAALLAAAGRWYELRRSWFSGMFYVIFEIGPDYWLRWSSSEQDPLSDLIPEDRVLH